MKKKYTDTVFRADLGYGDCIKVRKREAFVINDKKAV